MNINKTINVCKREIFRLQHLEQLGEATAVDVDFFKHQLRGLNSLKDNPQLTILEAVQ